MADKNARRRRPQSLTDTLGGISQDELDEARIMIAKEEGPDEDLKKASKIADDFMAGMDHVTKVLMVLVLKFGRASNLLVFVLCAIGLGLVIYITGFIVSWDVQAEIQAEQEALLKSQEAIQKQQTEVIEKAEEAILKAEKAYVQAEHAHQSAQEAKNNTPQIVIDSKGKKKLIVPSAKTRQVPADEPQTTPQLTQPMRVEIPLE